MKKFLLILLILFLCDCSSNSDRTKSSIDTIENTSNGSKISYDTQVLSKKISYDTVVIKSKKVEYKLIKHKPIILNETTPSGGNPIIYKHDVVTKPPIIHQPIVSLVNTREKRLLEVTPNIESTSKNLTGRLE